MCLHIHSNLLLFVICHLATKTSQYEIKEKREEMWQWWLIYIAVVLFYWCLCGCSLGACVRIPYMLIY